MSGRWTSLLRVELSLDTPWAIGGVPVPGAEADLPLIRDPRSGRPHLPGTSLAGALRAFAAERLGTAAAVELFGEVERRPGDRPGKFTTRAVPSTVCVLGAEPFPEQEPERPAERVAMRTRTAIDARSGAALRGSLRTEEVAVPQRQRLFLQLPGSPEDETAGRLLELLRAWRPWIGRGRSTGLGRARVVRIEAVGADLRTVRGLEWWLSERHGFCDGGPLPDACPGAIVVHEDAFPNAAEAEATLCFEFELLEPVHIGTEQPGPPERDRLRVGTAGQEPELVRLHRVEGRPAMPASSWKGVLRHRVETILRLVLGREGRGEEGSRDGEGRLVQDVLALLFGSLEHGRGLVWVRDGAFTAGSPDPGQAGGPAPVGKRTHVAIDRFSGGAKPSALFTWECVLPGSRVRLELDAPGLERSPACRNLLLHAVRDLHEGLIGIGAGTSRGYGTVALADGQDAALPQPEPVRLERLREELDQHSAGTRPVDRHEDDEEHEEAPDAG